MGREMKTTIAGKLFAALAKVDRPGAFSTSGDVPAVLPGLEVEGLGEVALPLTALQAKELKKRCEQAGYGKGEKTLVDTNVRRVWRLKPERFVLTNPEWEKTVGDVVAQVQTELGLEGRKLEAHLYDLLLYEEGGFFLPHRDSEKLDRMVATLIIVLPSTYEGGELVVRHEGQEEVIDFGGKGSRFQTRYAAFYADCEHEVKPLRSGVRLCLVYNLTLAKAGKSIGAPRNQQYAAGIADILRGWPADASAPMKMAITLGHQYTEAGLAWDTLKGVDAAQARALADAAQLAGCHVHLALLTLCESGSLKYAYENYGRGTGRRRYGEEISGENEMDELYDSTLTAAHWRTPAGGRPALGEVPIETDEVVPEESLRAVTPEEDVDGYMGNEGMTLTRWYRHAAILLWPDAHHFDVLCAAGARQAVGSLKRMIATWQKAKGEKAAAQKILCRTFAEKILDHWMIRKHQSWKEASEPDAYDVTPSLHRLEDPELIRTYLGKVLVQDVSLEPGRDITKAIQRHGWAAFRRELVILFKATNSETLERNVMLLARLCATASAGAKKQGPEAEETCRAVADATLAALARLDAPANAEAWRADRRDNALLITILSQALLFAGLDDLLARTVSHINQLPKRYTLRGVHVPALLKTGKWAKEKLHRRSPELSAWMSAAVKELESLTAAIPEPPTDFRREANVECKCLDCKSLVRFLSDPGEPEHGFQMGMDRRVHLENQISHWKCDVTCRTDKRPRPQVLICTKTTASYDQRLKEYHENVEHAAALRSLLAELPP